MAKNSVQPKITDFCFFVISPRIQKPDLEQALDVNHAFDGTGMLDEDEENFQKALALSRQEIDMEDEEADLRRAIQLSMQGKMLA